MPEFPVRNHSDPDSTECPMPPYDRHSQPKHLFAHGRALTNRVYRARTFLLSMLSCSLVFALSGCQTYVLNGANAEVSLPPACTGTRPAPTTAPSQAVAAGFNTLAFDDEFNTQDTISPNNQGKYNWYTWNVYGASKQLTSADYKVSNGCLTISTDLTGSGADLQTVNSGSATTGLFQYGYFEARIQFDPTGSQGGNSWPAFWADALQSIPEVSPFAELDFMEAVPKGKGGATAGWNGVTIMTTAHQWTKGNEWNDDYNTNHVTPMPDTFDYAAFHVYGCLWTPSSVTWYIDDQMVMTLPIGPGTYFTALEQDRIFLILGTGKNWPTTFDYVRVWH